MSGSTGNPMLGSTVPQNVSPYSAAATPTAPQSAMQGISGLNTTGMDQGTPGVYATPDTSMGPNSMGGPISPSSYVHNPMQSPMSGPMSGSIHSILSRLGQSQYGSNPMYQPQSNYAPVNYSQMISSMGQMTPKPAPINPVPPPTAGAGGTGGTSFDLGYQAPQADPAATGRGGITDLFSRAQIADRNRNRQMRRAR